MKCIKWEKLILLCLALHLQTWSWSIFGPTKHDMKRTFFIPPSRACNFSFLHNITATTMESFATKDITILCFISGYIHATLKRKNVLFHLTCQHARLFEVSFTSLLLSALQRDWMQKKTLASPIYGTLKAINHRS